MKRVAVFAGTRNVYRNMVISAKSLLAHTHMDRVYFLIEDDVFPQPLPNVITCMQQDWTRWFEKDGPNFNSHVTYMSAVRVALPDIFWEESRVLWLDTDIIVEKDIGLLFDMDMEGNYVAMTEEPIRSQYPFRYHNAGVMLMDLDRIRRDRLWEKWIRLYNRQEFTAQEQDCINVLTQGEILTIGPEWNCAGSITQHVDDPYIRHYAGGLKYNEPEEFREWERAEWSVI